jgi:phosphomannomutase
MQAQLILTIEAIESQARAIYTAPAIAHKSLSDYVQAGQVETFDPSGKYLARLAEIIDIDRIKKSSLNIVVDPMYGSGMSYFPDCYRGTLQLLEINNERNPFFGGVNPEPIAKNLAKLMHSY